MAQPRRATRNSTGGALSEEQVEAAFTAIRDGRQRVTQAAMVGMIEQHYAKKAADIEVASMKVKLVCPLSMARVQVPVRAVGCRHIQCFDLRSYLDLHRQLTFWRCPICEADAHCDSLCVDEYMSDVLRATDDSILEVEIHADGTFEAVQRPTSTEMETIEIDDEDAYVPKSCTERRVETEANENSVGPVGAADGSEAGNEPKRLPREHNKPRKGPFACTDCGRMFNDRGNMYKHKRLHTGVKPYKCELCGMLFQYSVSLRAHESVHTGVKPYKCGTCGKTFTLSVYLRVHERIHTGKRPYECGQCGAAFAQSKNLRAHERIHVGVKPHICGVCGAAFVEASGLRKHESLHKGGKRFKCSHCDKLFTTSSDRRVHERTHTGEKPFTCELCGKAFTTSGGRRVHERTHTGEKPFTCELCGKAFADFGNLRRHETTHTRERPYKCAACGAAFTRADGLRGHAARTQHSLTTALTEESEEAKKTA
ncbi:hypothetical protein AAVH_18177 [Aphelenchoides avenae]|nr:hypothetical protein AAVH_18177 [Aphelenchus avenae]